MGLPFINDFIKHFKAILLKKNIIRQIGSQKNVQQTDDNQKEDNQEIQNQKEDNQQTDAQKNMNVDIIILDVSSIIFKFMMGHYLSYAKVQPGSGSKFSQSQDLDCLGQLDPVYSDEEDDEQQNQQPQQEQPTTPTSQANLPSIQECINKIYSYARIFEPNVCQIFVFDPIPQKVQRSETDPNINKRLLELIASSKVEGLEGRDLEDMDLKDANSESINSESIKLKDIKLQIDFEKLKQIKSSTWQQRSKTKYIDAANAIKWQMTELYNQLAARSESFQSTHIVMSKYESDIMIGSLYGRLSTKYNILTISEDSDMLIHAYPGKVFIPHNGVFDTYKFWKILNINSKQVLSQIPFHYGCDYQLKTMSITSKESFQFIKGLNAKVQQEKQCDEQQVGQQEEQDEQQKLIQTTFLYETLIEDDFQQKSIPFEK